MPENDRPALTADQISELLDQLFTNGQGARADRLVLAQDLPDGSYRGYRDLGGWGREVVRDKLAAIRIKEP